MPGLSTKNATAYVGDSARRMLGWRMISATPSADSTPNHTSMTGPNILPTTPVPNRCTTNTPVSSAKAMGTTSCSTPGAATCRPSTADSTEIAGVIIPSP